MGEKHNGPVTRDGIRIHSEADFAGMRAAGRLAADILDRIGDVVPGTHFTVRPVLSRKIQLAPPA